MFNLIRKQPVDISSFFDPFNEKDLFENLFGKSEIEAFKKMKTDIHENETSYILETELPGCKKEDIKIDIKDNCLTISAKKENVNEERDKKGNCIHCERGYGEFSRSFDVEDIDSKNITATYTDGILTLVLPKKDPVKTEKVEITID